MQTHIQRKDDVMRHREDGHLQAPERDLEQISPLTVPGRNQPCRYLILDFSSAELHSRFLLLKPTGGSILLQQPENECWPSLPLALSGPCPGLVPAVGEVETQPFSPSVCPTVMQGL